MPPRVAKPKATPTPKPRAKAVPKATSKKVIETYELAGQVYELFSIGTKLGIQMDGEIIAIQEPRVCTKAQVKDAWEYVLHYNGEDASDDDSEISEGSDEEELSDQEDEDEEEDD